MGALEELKKEVASDLILKKQYEICLLYTSDAADD